MPIICLKTSDTPITVLMKTDKVKNVFWLFLPKNQDFPNLILKYQENIKTSRPNFSNHDKIKKIKTCAHPAKLQPQ